ncbi:uncharacterized protein [Heptranchias perlo]|uniref:uncharacterized protein n=1 Tax=Heptranchias perlo TaxID=212740 RepID=UPI003559B4C9
MMHLCLLFFALLFLLPYCPLADVIHQWPRSIAVVQGGEAEINCYQNGTARDNMLWYQQSAGQGLTIIGYIYRSSKAEYEDGFKTGFEITRTMNDKMSSLKIQSVNPSNAADYFCAAGDGAQCRRQIGRPYKICHRDTVVCDQNMMEFNVLFEREKPVSATKILNLGKANFNGMSQRLSTNGTARSSMLWYKSAGGGLLLIGKIVWSSQAEMEEEFKARFQMVRSDGDKKSTLKITGLGRTDTALYYCAAGDGAQRFRMIHNPDKNPSSKGRRKEAETRRKSITERDGERQGGEMNLALPKVIQLCLLAVVWRIEESLVLLRLCNGVSGNNDYIFGHGSKLVVVEHEIQDPKVVVFQPSPEEIQKKEKATVVCLVTGFYPDNIYIHWLVDGKKKDSKDTSIHTDSNSIAGEGGKHYSISSRLRFEAKDWAVSKNVLCEVEHYQIGSKHETFKAKIDIKAEICGVSKEEKMQSMGTAKLSYLILICKSILYATFISILVWKTKASYSKRFD